VISVLDMKTSSSVTILSLGWVTLTQIVLYVRVNKENSLEFLLFGVYYLYKSNYLYMFTDLTILHNEMKKKRKEK